MIEFYVNGANHGIKTDLSAEAFEDAFTTVWECLIEQEVFKGDWSFQLAGFLSCYNEIRDFLLKQSDRRRWVSADVMMNENIVSSGQTDREDLIARYAGGHGSVDVEIFIEPDITCESEFLIEGLIMETPSGAVHLSMN